ncbi:MAG: hypothetical protein ACTSU4_05920 [Promethearchaeota archaeon]
MEWTRMMRGAKTILEDCVSLQKGEKLLIITDTLMISIAQVLMAVINEREAAPVLIILNPREHNGQEPPLPVGEAMKQANLILCPVSKSITHTTAIKNATNSGAHVY